MLCAKDFMNRQRKYNNETLQQLWMSTLSDVHECICECDKPFAHCLALMFPLGHQDRNKTINQILARDYKEKCLSGGLAGDGFGSTEETIILKENAEQERDTQKEDTEDLTALLAAADAAEEEAR